MSDTRCVARRMNDEMQCHRCGTAWSVKDVRPSDCLTLEQYTRMKGNEAIEKLKQLMLGKC
jgi:hypothetical protein